MDIVGRKQESMLLKKLLGKSESSLVALHGRKRTGKTFLIESIYESQIVFRCRGVEENDMSLQLASFWCSINEINPVTISYPPPKTWIEAFFYLRTYLKTFKNHQKKVVFFDEIPWFETPKSDFLTAIDIFWNQYCVKQTNIILVICGSTAHWIMDKIINSRDGLYKPLTQNRQ